MAKVAMPALASGIVLIWYAGGAGAQQQPAHSGQVGIKVTCSKELIKRFKWAETTIHSAMIVPASGSLLQYCDVRGTILPEIGFAVKMLTRWNGNLYMAGKGGKAGNIEHEVTGAGLMKGYAAVGTETGHDNKKEPGATFAR
jgi:hypothetical protein